MKVRSLSGCLQLLLVRMPLVQLKFGIHEDLGSFTLCHFRGKKVNIWCSSAACVNDGVPCPPAERAVTPSGCESHALILLASSFVLCNRAKTTVSYAGYSFQFS